MSREDHGYVPYTLYPPTKQQAIRCVQRTIEVRSNPQNVTYIYADEGSSSVPLLKAVPPVEYPAKTQEISPGISLQPTEPNLNDTPLTPQVESKVIVAQSELFKEEQPSCSRKTEFGKYHKFPKTYVEKNRRWTYRSEASVATADEDGQLYYNPDPYRPAPPAKGAPSTLARMHYAAQRIDNRKYRGQRTKARATNQMESASCDRCKMRFFLPYNHFRSHISYALSTNRFALPLTFFNCPVCHSDTQIIM